MDDLIEEEFYKVEIEQTYLARLFINQYLCGSMIIKLRSGKYSASYLSKSSWHKESEFLSGGYFPLINGNRGYKKLEDCYYSNIKQCKELAFADYKKQAEQSAKK